MAGVGRLGAERASGSVAFSGGLLAPSNFLVAGWISERCEQAIDCCDHAAPLSSSGMQLK